MYHATIGHVMLYVRDLERSIDFYCTVLNLQVTERAKGKCAFLTSGGPHHEIAFYALGPDAPGTVARSIGLNHLAFNVPDKRSFAEAYCRLIDAKIDVSPVDHRIGWGLYFNDPDGNELEVYCDTRTEPDGAQLWEGKDRPLSNDQILAEFSIDRTRCAIAEGAVGDRQLSRASCS